MHDINDINKINYVSLVGVCVLCKSIYMKRKHKPSARRPTTGVVPASQTDDISESRQTKWRTLVTAVFAVAALLAGMFLVIPDYTGPRHSTEAERKSEQEGGTVVDSGVGCAVLIDRAQAIFDRYPVPNAEWEKSLDLLATCAVQEPNNPLPRWKLAVGLMQMGRVDEAMAFLDEAIDPMGKNIELLKTGGTLLSTLGYHAEAIRCLETYLGFVLSAPSWDQLLVGILQQSSDQWPTFLQGAGHDVVLTLEVLLHSYLQDVSLVKAGYVYRVIIGLKGPENCRELLQAYSSFAFGLGDLATGIKYLRTYTELQYMSEGYGGQMEAYEVVAAHSLRLLMAGADSHIILMAKNLLHFGRPVWEELAYHCALVDGDVIDFQASIRLTQVAAIYIKCLTFQKLIGNLADEGAAAYSENRFGWTPLLHAVALGDSKLVNILLGLGADPQTRTTVGHTSLHVAAMRGTHQVVPALLRGGVRPGDQDYFNRTALGVACLHRWSIDGMARALGSKVPDSCPSHPSYAPPVRLTLQGGWLGSGSGLPSALTNERCDIDVMATPNITDFIFNYLSLGRPVLVRNASNSHSMKELYQRWQRVKMEGEYGFVQLHRLHTSHWEGREDSREGRTTLKNFMAAMKEMHEEHRNVEGGAENVPAPDYVFERLPGDSPLLAHFELPSVLNPNHTHILPTYTYFYIGPSLSGENIHPHKNSWNLLIYGQRRLFLLPPTKALYSKQLIWNWWKDHHSHSRDVLECVQYPGDLLFVPDMWAAGSINVRESVGLKSEFVYGASEFSL